MPSFVSLDIETTGTDPFKDAIIEIGAVRFNGRRIEDEWSSLINPGRPIPEFITRLTGITGLMVAQAPPIRDILTDFADFVGTSPILGQNIAFDLSFFVVSESWKIMIRWIPMKWHPFYSQVLNDITLAR
jgi:DNA polymerase III epsilon subunit family exonuclease